MLQKLILLTLFLTIELEVSNNLVIYLINLKRLR